MEEKNKIRVVIDGISFNISGQEDESYMNHIASYVDKAIGENTKRNPHLSKTEGIILLALNLKDQLEKEKIKYKDFRESVSSTDNLKTIKELEEAQEKLRDLEKKLGEKDRLLEGYKSSQAGFEKALNDEIIKSKDLEEKLEDKKISEDSKDKEAASLRQKLQIQEGLNYDRNKEIINLKNYIRALKEEIKSLDK